MSQDLRSFVAQYEQAHPGEVVRIAEPVATLTPGSAMSRAMRRRSLRVASTAAEARRTAAAVFCS